MSRNYKFETLQLHAGQKPTAEHGARAVPIYQTASYVFEDTETAAQMFSQKIPGFTYSRHKNPTMRVFEERMAALEGGVDAVACASGMAAQFLAINALASSGDSLIANSCLYGGTTVQLKYSLARLGIHTEFVESENADAYAAKINEKTKAIFIETIANPKMSVLDIRKIADVAHEHNIPLIVDNTFGAGGYLCAPLRHGADIITHSATKWIGGHGTSLGGVVIDGGTFDWKRGNFPNLTCPAPMCHGLVFADLYEQKALSAFIRTELLKHFGPSLSPFNAFLLLQGLETLSLRVERHCDNARKLAQWLEAHPKVQWVWYPGLKSSPYFEMAQKYFRNGLFGSMLAFGVVGGIEAGRKTIEAFELVSHLANVGDAKTLAIHPASTTHENLSKHELEKSGVLPEGIRVSVGIENIEDIIHDFEIALTTVL